MCSSGGEWLSIEDLMEKISNKSAQERKMSQANHLSYSARMRGRSKQPVYSSDKRAKFTQRDSQNCNWIRLITVVGYILSVSLPAISLSIYYIYIWDPGYITKYPAEPMNKTVAIHKSPILPKIENLNGIPVTIEQKVKEANNINLASILKESLSSMESSEKKEKG